MPRTRAVTASVQPPSLIASVSSSGGHAPTIYRKHTAWQNEAWRFFDITGELHYAATWISNTLSRAVIGVGKREGSGPASAKAEAARDALFYNSAGQAAILAGFGLHLTVAGEGYLVGRTLNGTDTWEVVGTHEMRVNGTQWSIDYGDGRPPVILAKSDVVLRIWRPHPSKRIEADSPVRSLLPILTELEYLTRHVFAQVTSRLAGAGILFLPQGFQFPPQPGSVEPANSAEGFVRVLGENMMRPIHDPGDPASLVPVVVTVPDEMTDKPNLMTFWSDLDQNAGTMRDEAIRRFAVGMDLPPEIVLGLASSGSGANHWTSWQIEESSIKVHIEPLLQLICDALTAGYLNALAEPDDVFTFDTSAIRLRPDRSKEAIELYDRGELDGEALRRETGFDEDDVPTDPERVQWLLRKIASGSTTPEQVAAAARQLGVELPTEAVPTTEARPAPSLREHPVNDIPERPDRGEDPRRNNAAINAACEAFVYRALERAGNRLRSASGVRVPDVRAHETHLHIKATRTQLPSLLMDAVEMLPTVLASLDDNSTERCTRLSDYCKMLIVQQQAHDPELMRQFLWGGNLVPA